MSLSLYDLTVPLLIRQLSNLLDILKEGEKWAAANPSAPPLAEGRLAPDMLQLPFQIHTVCNTAKGVLSRIGGESNVSMEDTEKTFPEFYERIEKTIALLKAAKKENFKGPEERVELQAGPTEVKFTAVGYVQKYVLPNFYFHVTTAYLILRNAGVPLGKAVFLDTATIADF